MCELKNTKLTFSLILVLLSNLFIFSSIHAEVDIISMIAQRNRESRETTSSPDRNRPAVPGKFLDYASLEGCPFSIGKDFVIALSELRSAAESFLADKKACTDSLREATSQESPQIDRKTLTLIDEIEKFDEMEAKYERTYRQDAGKYKKALKEMEAFEAQYLEKIAEAQAKQAPESEIEEMIAVFNESMERYAAQNLELKQSMGSSEEEIRKFYEGYENLNEVRTLRDMKADLIFQLVNEVNGTVKKIETVDEKCFKQDSTAQIVGSLITEVAKVLSFIPNEVGAVAKVVSAVSATATNLITSIQHMIETKAISEIDQIINIKAFECLYWKFEQMHCKTGRAMDADPSMKPEILRRIYKNDKVKPFIDEYQRNLMGSVQLINNAVATSEGTESKPPFPWLPKKKSVERISVDKANFKRLIARANGIVFENTMGFLDYYFNRYYELVEVYPELEKYELEITYMFLAAEASEFVLSINEMEYGNVDRAIRFGNFSSFISSRDDADLFRVSSYPRSSDSGSSTPPFLSSGRSSSSASGDPKAFFDAAYEMSKMESDKDQFLASLEEKGVTFPDEIPGYVIAEIFLDPISQREESIMYPKYASQMFAAKMLDMYKEYLQFFTKSFSPGHIDLINFIMLLEALDTREFDTTESVDNVFLYKRAELLSYISKNDFAKADEADTQRSNPGAIIDVLAKIQVPMQRIMLKPLMNGMIETFINLYGEYAYFTTISRYWNDLVIEFEEGNTTWDNLAEIYRSVTTAADLVINNSVNSSLILTEMLSVLMMPTSKQGYLSERDLENLKVHYNRECVVFGNFIRTMKPKLYYPKMNGIVLTGTQAYNTLCNNDYFTATYDIVTGLDFNGNPKTASVAFDPARENVCTVYEADIDRFLLNF
ncbi:MAG: hypothetical protein ABIA04_14235 [Pseudomonadota bacterium]